jgi:hypothetical protein
MEATAKTYIYHFIFPDGSRKLFQITLDSAARYRHPGPCAGPQWTLLTYNRCAHCQLSESQHSHCPVAVNIADLVEAFRDIVSHDRCTVTCVSSERSVSKETIVQDGLRSIMGIIMATSGCPTLDLLRPMAWFHLPFASIDESLFRSASTYLLGQFFHAQSGHDPDFSLEKIKDHYLHIEQVNHHMLERIRDAAVHDADRNAIVILNSLAQILGMEVEEGLERLRPLFC